MAILLAQPLILPTEKADEAKAMEIMSETKIMGTTTVVAPIFFRMMPRIFIDRLDTITKQNLGQISFAN